MSFLYGFAVPFVGGLGVGAYLVVEGHPWFGLLVILITSRVSHNETSKQ
jgi:hypothetical protein